MGWPRANPRRVQSMIVRLRAYQEVERVVTFEFEVTETQVLAWLDAQDIVLDSEETWDEWIDDYANAVFNEDIPIVATRYGPLLPDGARISDIPHSNEQCVKVEEEPPVWRDCDCKEL